MKDKFTRQWIIEKSENILSDYPGGITIRQLHYRLVAIGMTNDINHYKRVVGAMTKARWEGIIEMDSFIDREREVFGGTQVDEKDVDQEIAEGKNQILAWMNNYSLNKWSNQRDYIEVWIEKKALQGVFEDPCSESAVGLAPCKGYPSITYLYEASERFKWLPGYKNITLLYFGDYDPSGLDIPRSIQDNLAKLGVGVEIDRVALLENQIKKMGLPGVPPKVSDTRTVNWGGGRVVECDAVEPRKLAKMCRDAINSYFDFDLYEELREVESVERDKYQKALKAYMRSL